MRVIVLRLLVVIFFALSLIHFYWGLGGQWGFENVLPSNEAGIALLDPSILDTIIVGGGLLLMGAFYLCCFDLIDINFNHPIIKVIKWCIPIIFLIRAIGDFKYVGFFKTIDMTDFAHMDTFFYSPLCLLIALMGYFVARG